MSEPKGLGGQLSEEFREGNELFKEIFKALVHDWRQVLHESWPDTFSPSQKHNATVQETSLTTQKSSYRTLQTTSGSQSTRSAPQNVTHLKHRVYVSQQWSEKGLTRSYSLYSISSLDAISFDPFIIQADISHDAARNQGLFGLLRVQGEAWLEERLTGATVRKLQSRQAVLEEQRRTAEAGHRLRRAVLNPEQKEQVFVETARAAVPQTHELAISNSTPLRPNVTGDQIEAAALRALLEGVRTEQDWVPYEEALKRHFPPYAVQEVGDRLRELWDLNPDGPTME